MWWIISLLISCLAGALAAPEETLCTSNTCFTLDTDKKSFEEAQQTCVNNGGYLMTVRDREEEDLLRSVLSQLQRQRHKRTFSLWIGLKQHRGTCGLGTTALRGFQWVSGQQDSNYSNWEREPVSTCTDERCVRIQYTASAENRLGWRSSNCRGPFSYVCQFYFKGMCEPLALTGPGEITYTAPFSQEPQHKDMQTFPVGTYAEVSCSDQQSHYSVCMPTDGAFQWTSPGPFCRTGEQRSCEIDNGGCEHRCRRDADRIRCACQEGFLLREDGFSCSLENPCGAHTCQHQCVVAGPAGSSCTCPDGFTLDADQRSCSDVDECELQACRPHRCVNTPGSYQCACGAGYQMVAGGCEEVDGCSLLGCHHGCSRQGGNSSCYCNPGFALSEDGRSCRDVDECDSSPCQFECANTDGGFLCSCPQGSRSPDGGLTCYQDSTEPTAPSSGGQTAGGRAENFTQPLIGAALELQRQSPQTESPLATLENATQEDPHSNVSLVAGSTHAVNSRVLICVLGSVIPLALLVAVTSAIAIFRCSRAKKEAKKAPTADGYCWVSSGLDPRLEKLYDSISTDDL